MYSLTVSCLALTSLSIIGVLLPVHLPIIQKHLATIRPFGTGCILSIALLHLLPDALESAEGIKLPHWAGDFPLVEGLAVLGFVLMVAFDEIFSSPCEQLDTLIAAPSLLPTAQAPGGFKQHCHHSPSCPDPESTPLPTSSTPLLNSAPSPTSTFSTSRLYMLEFSISLHSILVGLPVTSSSSPSLLYALCFHQLFEGTSLGLAFLSSPGRPPSKLLNLSLLFGGSISVGVTLGYYFTAISPTLTAYTNSLAAGIVLFVAFEFYQKDFGHSHTHPHLEQDKGREKGKFASFVVGVAALAAVAIWA
jgi:zinc transporter ZupT